MTANSVVVTKRETQNGAVWQYRFEVSAIGGKRKWVSKSGFSTRREATLAGEDARNAYENTGRIVKFSEISCSDFLDYWIEHDVKQTCKQRTVEGYEKKLRLYVKPVLGQYRLQSITKQDVKDLLQGMYDKGYSLNTISNCKGILTKAFDYAVDSAYLSFSPASGIRSIKKTGRPPQTPTTTEPHVYIPQERIEQIFSRFPEGSSTHIPMMLGYHCGLRLGEAFGVVWEDVDWEHHALAINRQVQWNPNGGQDGYWYFAEPKYQSYRIIKLDDTMYDLLRREKARQEKAVAYFGQRYNHYYIQFPLVLGGTEPPTRQVENRIGEDGQEVHLINVRESGTFISPRTMQHTSLIIHHKLDYPDFDFHSLRHTHATMLKENGAQDVYIQHRLGHTKVEVTTQVYTNHLTKKMKEDGDNLLRKIY